MRRRRPLDPAISSYLYSAQRRLSLRFAAEGEGTEGGGEGAGAGGAGGGSAPKTYTEAEIAGLKAANAALKKEKDTLKARASVLGERTPEEVLADLEFAAKVREEKAREAGQLDEWKKQVTEKSAKELAAERADKQRYAAKVYDVTARSEAVSAITAAGGNPKVLLPHILPSIKVVEQDGDFVPQVVDGKGNPRIADGQGTPMTIAQLVDTFKTDENFGIAFAASGASGSGARNDAGGRGSGSPNIVLTKEQATDAQLYRRAKAEAEKRGGHVVISD